MTSAQNTSRAMLTQLSPREKFPSLRVPRFFLQATRFLLQHGMQLLLLYSHTTYRGNTHTHTQQTRISRAYILTTGLTFEGVFRISARTEAVMAMKERIDASALIYVATVEC